MLEILNPRGITQFFIGLGPVNPGKVIGNKDDKAFGVQGLDLIDKCGNGLSPVIELVDAVFQVPVPDGGGNGRKY